MNKIDQGPLFPIVVMVTEIYTPEGDLHHTTYTASHGGVSAVSARRDLAIGRCIAKLEGDAVARAAARAEQREMN